MKKFILPLLLGVMALTAASCGCNQGIIGKIVLRRSVDSTSFNATIKCDSAESIFIINSVSSPKTNNAAPEVPK